MARQGGDLNGSVCLSLASDWASSLLSFSTNERQRMALEYFVSERAPYLVISFRGPMRKDCVTVLQECQKLVQDSASNRIVLSLHGVTDLDPPAVAPFAALMKEVRDKKAK